MRNYILIFLLGMSLSASGAVRTTVANGSFMTPSTWDCNCFPTTNDDVIVKHNVDQFASIQVRDLTIENNASYTAYNYTTVSRDLDIESGANLTSYNYIFINGNYHVDGSHACSAYILIEGNNAELSGTGTININSWMTFRNGKKTIKEGTNLTFPTGYGIYLWTGTTTVSSFGKISLNYLGGLNSTKWVNDENSTLEVKVTPLTPVEIDARAINNEVIYSGDINQTLYPTQSNEYYNLSLISTNVSRRKLLSSDVKILNDIYIESTKLDAISYDIEIYGDWLNVDGVFDPNSQRVQFAGIDQEITATSGSETFYDLDLQSSDQVRINSELSIISNLSIATDLYAQGNLINLAGDWINNGRYVHGDNVVRMIGSTPSTINGDTEFYSLRINKNSTCTNNSDLTIRSSLRLILGNFITNDRVTFLSDVNGTARLDNVTSGSISGDVTVQRYLPTTTNDWHLLGSPVQGSTLADWNDDILTMGFIGSDHPGFYFNNATYYDESLTGHKDNGLINATNITNSIGVGQGWRLYLPIDVTTIDVKGAANVGTMNIPLSFTNSGSTLDDGWNLIANPYISTINWTTAGGWVKTGINDAIYIWNPSNSQYTTYIGGIGTNGGSKFIPSTQAFWVQANSSSPSLQILENAKVANDVDIKSKAGTNDYFKMIITSENNFSDEIAIRTNPKCS